MARTRRQKSAQSQFFPGFTDVFEIGTGSLATVYQAREAGTNRLVALKLLNVRDASPRAIESFERESVALGAVSAHPNIVTLYRSFRAADGRPVLVLELCTRSMGELTRSGHALPAPDGVALGIKIAAALETAHRAQILHRDVKPQNILVTEYGEPALADFGVAMLQSSTQTTAGLFDFTTLHAAPELLEGRETAAATDVYELASTLYQLVAGRSAFRAYDGESPASVILRILRDPVQPVVQANVPPALSDLLVRAMSKDMTARPASAADFAAQLIAIETAQGWPRTPFLIRDASGAPADLPRAPALHPSAPAPPFTPQPWTAPPPPPPLPAPPPPPQVWEHVATDWSSPTVSGHNEPDEPVPVVATPEPYPVPSGEPGARHAAPEPVVLPEPEPMAMPEPEPVVLPEPEPVVPMPEPVPVVPPVPEPMVPMPEPVPPSVVQWRSPLLPEDEGEPDEIGPALAAQPVQPEGGEVVQYPIPPAGGAAQRPAEPDSAAPAVPMWSFRAQVPAGQSAATDLRLDPSSLRERVTIRAAGASLSIDAVKLVSRQWLKRQEIPWHDVLGLETRRDADTPSADGVVVAVTHHGPVELPATRGTAGDLRYTHALLDAYRARARQL